jgi:hypothetical protein
MHVIIDIDGARELTLADEFCRILTLFHACRFVPAEEESPHPMTVDAEKLECRVVQGRIVPGGCRLMLKELTGGVPDTGNQGA